MSRRPVDPWESTASVRAGLPRERAAWLALVLPAMDASRSHVACAAVLSALCGRKVDRIAVMQWHMKLAAMLAAGALPERATPLPERRPGWQEGGPTPSPEASRKGAENRHAGLPPARASQRAEDRMRKIAAAVTSEAAKARAEAARLRAAAAAMERAETDRLRAEASLSEAREEAGRRAAEALAAKDAARKAREEARAKADAEAVRAKEARAAAREEARAKAAAVAERRAKAKAQRDAIRAARAEAKASAAAERSERRAKAKREAPKSPKRRRTAHPGAVALSNEAPCAHRTAAKALRGERVSPSVRAALEAAAARLGITLPPATPASA